LLKVGGNVLRVLFLAPALELLSLVGLRRSQVSAFVIPA
jgi:hypothetical protein